MIYRKYEDMRKIIKIITFIIIILIFLLSISIIVSNDNISKKVEKGLKSIPLPSNSKLIDSISASGKLTGNGNGMQYFGAILIKTELNEEDLEKYYKEYRKGMWDCFIKKQNSSEIDVIEHGSYSFKNFDGDESLNYYIIYSWGNSENDLLDLDIRGH